MSHSLFTSGAADASPPEEQVATPPAVQVVKGAPDDEELAALVAGLVATSVPLEPADDGTHSSVWNDSTRRWGVPTTPTRTAWRWSSHQVW